MQKTAFSRKEFEKSLLTIEQLEGIITKEESALPKSSVERCARDYLFSAGDFAEELRQTAVPLRVEKEYQKSQNFIKGISENKYLCLRISSPAYEGEEDGPKLRQLLTSLDIVSHGKHKLLAKQKRFYEEIRRGLEFNRMPGVNRPVSFMCMYDEIVYGFRTKPIMTFITEIIKPELVIEKNEVIIKPTLTKREFGIGDIFNQEKKGTRHKRAVMNPLLAIESNTKTIFEYKN